MNKILNNIISLFSSQARNFQTWNYTKQFGRKFEKSSKTSQTAVEVNRSQGNSAIVHTWYLENPQLKDCHTWPERILRSKSRKQWTLHCILISGTHWFQKCNRWKYSLSSFSIVNSMPFEILSKTKTTKTLLWKVIKTRWFWNFDLGDLENDL